MRKLNRVLICIIIIVISLLTSVYAAELNEESDGEIWDTYKRANASIQMVADDKKEDGVQTYTGYIYFTVNKNGSYSGLEAIYEGDTATNSSGKLYIVDGSKEEQLSNTTTGMYDLYAGSRYCIKIFNITEREKNLMEKINGIIYEFEPNRYTEQNPTTGDDNETPEEPILVDPNNPDIEESFLIDRNDKTITYKELPFMFQVKAGNDGTYYVEHDKKAKTVTFKYISNSTSVGYYANSGTETEKVANKYVQAGAISVPLEKNPQYPTHGIRTVEIGTSIPNKLEYYKNGKREFLIKNATLRTESTMETKSNSLQYVFVSSPKGLSTAYGTAYADTNTFKVDIYYYFEGDYDLYKDEEAEGLEAVLGGVLNGIGDVFAYLITLVAGSDQGLLTIDKIIFNEYPSTIIDFYGNTGSITSGLRLTINKWFAIFRKLSYVFYVVLLIYVAIKILLVAGNPSPQKKATYKQYIENWVIGLVIMTFVPLALKYMININNALVKYVGKERTPVYTILNKNTNFLANAGEDPSTVNIEELRANLKSAKDELEDVSEGGVTTGGAEYELLAGKVRQYAGVNLNSVTPLMDKISTLLNKIKSNIDAKGEWVSGYDDAALGVDIQEIYAHIAQNTKEGINFYFEGGTVVDNTEIDEKFRLTDRNGISGLIRQYASEVKQKRKLQGDISDIETQIEIEESGTDLMGDMRERAGKTRKPVYAIIYIILLFQLVFLLVLYFKRIFMIAALIIILPLVTVAFVLDKTKDGKSSIMNSWLTEIMANIFIQFMHAIVYMTVVQTAIGVYLADNNNWFLFVVAIMLLFPIEGIVRAMLGLQSSTVASLQDTLGRATTAVVAATSIAKMGANAKTKEATKEEERKAKVAQERKDKKQEKSKAREKSATKRRQYVDSRAGSTSGVRGAYYNAKKGVLNAKDKTTQAIKGSKVWQAGSKFKQGACKVGGAVRDRAGKVANVARKPIGVAVGVASGIAMGTSSSDFIAGAEIGRTIAGTTGSIKYRASSPKKNAKRTANRAKYQQGLNRRGGH